MFFRKSKKPKIRVIDIQGAITATKPPSFKKNAYNHYAILNELHKILTDDTLLGLILRINSPGGTAGASLELANEIYRLALKKPVIASVSDSACSGAYLAASACTKIFASEMAMIGSIGVVMNLPDVRVLADKIGFGMRTVKSVPFKDIGNPFREMTEQEEQLLSSLVKDSHKCFSKFVKEHRVNVNDIDNIADGRVFCASDAIILGLIDDMGTYFDAVGEMLQILGKTEKDVDFIEDEEDEGLVGKIVGSLSMNSSIESFLSSNQIGLR